MRLTIDTGKKEVVVHDAPHFEAVCDFMKLHFPGDWTRWRFWGDNLRTKEFTEKENEGR